MSPPPQRCVNFTTTVKKLRLRIRTPILRVPHPSSASVGSGYTPNLRNLPATEYPVKREQSHSFESNSPTVPSAKSPAAPPPSRSPTISPRLAAAVVVARIKPLDRQRATPAATDREAALESSEDAMYSGAPAAAARIVDLTAPLTEDVALSLLKENDPAALRVLRHSAAHVMATAILELFPETKLGHGPATDTGFFYDVFRDTPFTESDLAAIEARMAEVVARDEPFVRVEEPREQGPRRLRRARRVHEGPLHRALYQTRRRSLAVQERQLHRLLPRPARALHRRVKAFKLLSHRRRLLERRREEPAAPAHLRHRLLHAERSRRALQASRRNQDPRPPQPRQAARPLHHPGARRRRPHLLAPQGRPHPQDHGRLDARRCIRRGYRLVYTPHVMRRELWKISGHEVLLRKHVPAHGARRRRIPAQAHELPGPHPHLQDRSRAATATCPQRYAELGNVYRYERSGTMHGLLRVRGFTQDDAHIFCTPDQIEDEIVACLEFAESVLKTFGFSEFKVELSTWDPARQQVHRHAPTTGTAPIGALTSVLERARPSTTRSSPTKPPSTAPRSTSSSSTSSAACGSSPPSSSTSTSPRRFDLEYIGEDGKMHQPVMVHRALFGSVERFFGILIEHYAGAFPLWLAPVQVGLVPIQRKAPRLRRRT